MRALRVLVMSIAVLRTGTAGVESLVEVAQLNNSGITGGFGSAIAVSADTAVAGVCVGNAVGAAYVFVRSNGTWTQQAKLTPSDGVDFDFFGCSVAIDGDTILVGAYNPNASGTVYVFTRTNGVWSQQAKLTPSGPRVGEYFGWSVAIEGDLAVVGAENAGGSGAVYIFSRKQSLWKQDAKLTEPNPVIGDSFGSAVAVSGSTVLAGAWGRNFPNGGAFVIVSSSGNWEIEQELVGNNAAGSAVALDGDTALVGSVNSVSVFTRSSQKWTLQANLVPNGGQGTFDGFGEAVAISGGTAVVGAPNRVPSGAVYVFDNSTGPWSQAALLTPPATKTAVKFGIAVTAGGVILAGASVGNQVYAFGPPPANVELLSNPSGRTFTLSGAGCSTTGTFTTPYSGYWTQCTVQWTSPDSPSSGTRYTFLSWEDTGAVNPRSILPQPWPATYVADFRTEYQLTTAAIPSSGGAVVGAGWYTAGTNAPVASVANPGFVFTGFTGALSGAQTQQLVLMDAPKSVSGVFVPTPPAVLTGGITAKSGPSGQRLWTISLSNTGPGTGYAAMLFMLTFAQTFGVPCTVPPVRLSPAAFPVSAGTLNAGASAQTQAVIDFTGCPGNARFTVNIGYMSNGGSSGGVIQLVNQVQ